jgi:hypothetical protein
VVDGVKGVGVSRFGLGRLDSHEYGRVAIVSQETPAVKKRQILSQSLAVHPSILSAARARVGFSDRGVESPMAQLASVAPRRISARVRKRCFDGLAFKPIERPSSNRARFPPNVWVLDTEIVRRKTVKYLGRARRPSPSFGLFSTRLEIGMGFREQTVILAV